MVKGMSSL